MKRKLRNLRYREKQKAKTNSQNGKVYTPSKEDIEEKQKLESERAQELSEKYGTSNPDCIKFRLLETKKDRNADWFNHLGCAECQKWMKNQGCDLNASSKKFAELEGYGEMFKDSNSEPSTMGENKKGWGNLTNENDPDIQQSLNPKTPKEKEPEPLHPCQKYEDPEPRRQELFPQEEDTQQSEPPPQQPRKPNNPDVDEWLRNHQKQNE